MNGIAQGSAGNGKRDNEGAGMMDSKRVQNIMSHVQSKCMYKLTGIENIRFISGEWGWIVRFQRYVPVEIQSTTYPPSIPKPAINLPEPTIIEFTNTQLERLSIDEIVKIVTLI